MARRGSAQRIAHTLPLVAVLAATLSCLSAPASPHAPIPASPAVTLPPFMVTTAFSLTLPSSWPFPAPSPEQIASARSCESLLLQSQQNPPPTLPARPTTVPETDDPCALAHIAYDYLARSEYGQGPPQAGIEAFSRTPFTETGS